jgi:hypothetical protein
MKTKHIEKNKDSGQMEASVVLSNQEIILIKEALNFYIEKNLGDAGDPKDFKIKKELKKELHKAWRSMNPS